MHFKRLRLAGFKSFVDPTELLIEPGLTGIVGPNGCGKSNLLEALRWVMGESRPKSLRGGGMEDVIFAGTDMRPRRNLADVALLIDNSARTAPAQYNDSPDVEVSRRIERDLGSLYKINGRDVRQKDVQLLFADAATGATSPALVSQGRVGALINAKPQDRRQILEDAAGISGLHSRRKEAEQKLRAAGTNLERLEDVLLGMDGQANALRRQAKQAIRYRSLSELIRQLEAQLLFARWRVAQHVLEGARGAFQAAEADVVAATSASANVSRLQADVSADLPALRQSEADAAAALSRIEAQAQTLESELARVGALQDDLARRLGDVDKDMAREADYSRDAADALAKADADITRLAQAMDGDGARTEELRAALKTAQDAASAAQQALDETTQSLANARAKDQTTRGALSAAKTDMVRAEQALAAQKSAVAALELASDDGPRGEAQAALDAAEADLEATQAALESAQSEEEALGEAARTAREACDGARADLRRLDSEIEGVKAALKASSQSGDAVPIADLIKIEAGFETALGAAIGDHLELPVDDGLRHWQASSPHPDDPSLPDGLDALADKVSGTAHLSRRLTQTGIAGDAAAADALAGQLKPGQQIVTRDGGLWRWDGLRAQAGAPGRASLRLAQRNHLDSLVAKRPDLEKAVTQAQASLEAASTAQSKAKEARQQARKALEEANRTAGRARQAAREADAKERALVEKRSAALALLESREVALVAAQEGLADAEAAVAALPDLSQQDAHLNTLRTKADDLRTALGEARAAFDSHVAAAQGRQRAHDRARFERKQWEDRVAKADSQRETLTQRRTEIATALEELKSRPDAIARQRDGLTQALSDMAQKRRAAADALAAKEEALRQAESQLRSAQEALSSAREARARCEVEQANASSRLEEILAQSSSQFDRAPAQLLPLTGVEEEGDIDLPEDIAAQIDRRTLERERLGAVNLRADTELSELEEEAGRMRAEKEELETAIARLRGAIGALNREGRTRLMAAFDEVNQHFTALFTTLFGGGTAHIELIESDDPLEAGLEIMASPPGKKLQSLSLLSGGEQALTALSLIFAVFMTNPAPICVLDEVDAPLDDANVERFCTLLEDMIERADTRFLIVTHNALTMSRMHRLFGVTMAERGVSQLVSVDLAQAETMVAAE